MDKKTNNKSDLSTAINEIKELREQVAEIKNRIVPREFALQRMPTISENPTMPVVSYSGEPMQMEAIMQKREDDAFQKGLKTGMVAGALLVTTILLRRILG